jgi:hypothetical protein
MSNMNGDADGKPRSPFRSPEHARSFLDYLWPHLLERVRSTLPVEVRGMVKGATEAPGLDDLSLYALADWLEERQWDDVAARVRRMRIEGGELLVISADRPLSSAALGELRESARRLQDQLKVIGKDVLVLVLPHGLGLQAFLAGGAHG